MLLKILGGIFDKNQIRDKLEDLEKKLQEENFWKNKDIVKKTIKQKKVFEEILSSYNNYFLELSNIQDLGFKVALLTDGRMSGASGKILAAIHVTPEAIDNGVIGKIEDDDEIEIDANNGKLNILTDISKRKNSLLNDMKKNQSFGRNIFNTLRIHSQGSEEGGGIKLIN